MAATSCVKDTQRALEHMGQAPYSIKKRSSTLRRERYPLGRSAKVWPDERRRLMEAAVKGEREEAVEEEVEARGLVG